MRFSGILTAAAVAAVIASPAAANPLSRILAKSGLTPQDTNIMRQAEQSLLAEAQGGKRAKWSNPDSGAHGEVQVAGKEGDCVLLQHQAFVKDDQTPKQARRKFCLSEGKWLLSQ
ncbi:MULTISPECIES: hypothetical protein [unclassified Leisingera]|uniref:hypothetical protein n=1 Tax=unclassified Leisingera TaxID=2614906 RepID=UPI0002F97636|nr:MULTISPECIES: hypothetical protein [unclassified Leisingera]KIC16343.1 hypothetical protein RA21_11850 [Leisingera sp. ANG-DT]KIC24493.1 hypothetical protein RA23_07965 [Leisingera sp. ANG-S3]KIC26214.1 hypothetical protein RA24_18295 [Leisingera sp. ANG-M6]KIC28225.1 hypothetical protein RA25_21575 [Leisingera sp. ANG-S5]KIC55648.1 hypothetical protein RA22_02645 [Leisingera sp. ANG-S]